MAYLFSYQTRSNSPTSQILVTHYTPSAQGSLFTLTTHPLHKYPLIRAHFHSPRTPATQTLSLSLSLSTSQIPTNQIHPLKLTNTHPLIRAHTPATRPISLSLHFTVITYWSNTTLPFFITAPLTDIGSQQT